jgi:hypothetical protein
MFPLITRMAKITLGFKLPYFRFAFPWTAWKRMVCIQAKRLLDLDLFRPAWRRLPLYVSEVKTLV